jgi:hypothetical protein
MPEEYSSEQFWKLYENIPQALKEAVFSEETAENIWNICIRNEVLEGATISAIAKYTGRVLMGVLPPEDFQSKIEKELQLPKDTANKISQEIDRLVFYPVKNSLEELYTRKVGAPPSKTTESTPKTTSPKKEKPKAPKKDSYREQIE